MSFDSFAKELAATPLEFDALKVVQMAQAIKESGRGKSELFELHKNPFGMKYRSEMAEISVPARYTDWQGEEDHYCSFASYSEAIRGYWIFIDRSPYIGWRRYSHDPAQFIEHIVFAGYLGGTNDQRADYIASILRLFPEAMCRLRGEN